MEATKTRGAAPGREPGPALKDHFSPDPTSRPGDAAPLSAEQVYHDYAPRVYNMARRMVRNDLDAEDVTQDVLLQVVRKLPTFRGESAFPTWLHRVTVNTALAHRRKRAAGEVRRVYDTLENFLADGYHVTVFKILSVV